MKYSLYLYSILFSLLFKRKCCLNIIRLTTINFNLDNLPYTFSKNNLKLLVSEIILINSITCLYPKELMATSNLMVNSQLVVADITDSKNKYNNKNNNQILTNGLISGALTRAAKEIILHPVETIKARVQVSYNNIATATDNSISNIKNNSIISIYTNSNLYQGIFDGIIPSLLGSLPAGALFFGIKDYLKVYLNNVMDNKELITIIAVILANFPYWIAKAPFEVLKTRDQIEKTMIINNNINNNNIINSNNNINNNNQTINVYLNGINTIKEEYKINGFNGVFNILYSSYISNIVYALPADIIKFLSYEKLKVLLYNKETKIEGFEAAVTGALSSLIAQLVTTPLDVARTRIMTNNNNICKSDNDTLLIVPNYNNPFTTVNLIWKEEGYKGITRGTIPRIIRALLSGAIQFATYEITQNYLNQ